VDKKMSLIDFTTDPINTMVEPFTNLFAHLINPYAGGVFWLFPVIILTYSIHLKVKNPAVTSLFMIGSGATLSGGGMFLGAGAMVGLFIVFTAIGFVKLFMDIYFQRG